jgi:hypothetical protein
MNNSIASMNFKIGPQTTTSELSKSGLKKGKPNGVGDAIKVCIRVRPLLPNELMKDEIVYYPEQTEITRAEGLQAIRLADG